MLGKILLTKYKANEEIPEAPFITDTNAWTKLGLKTALKEAFAQGDDKIAWTTGEQQNARYDLTNLANYAKAEFQIRDIKEINIDIVNAWIESKNIGYNTASNYMSELNKVSDHFNFTKEEIKELRADLKKELPKAELETRAYKNLEKIELKEKHQVAFILR